MRAKIFFITLAVDDLDRSAGFYRDGLGWPTQGIVGQEFHDEVTGADGTIAILASLIGSPIIQAVPSWVICGRGPHMPGEGVCSGVRADACPGFDLPGQGVEVTGCQAGACASAHLVAGAGEHLDGQWGPVVVLRAARRGGEQGLLSGTGTLSSAPTLLITGRAAR